MESFDKKANLTTIEPPVGFADLSTSARNQNDPRKANYHKATSRNALSNKGS
jgi:hypothetical protein